MSTKCTIAYGEKFHFFEECFDPDRVYLRLEGNAANTEIEGVIGDSSPRVTVGIDVAIWRQIVEAWVKSHWGQHPERDYDLAHPDYDATMKDMLSMLAHPSPVVREGALHGLAKLVDHTHADALREALHRHSDEANEPSPGVRAVAKEMLETTRRIYSKDK